MVVHRLYSNLRALGRLKKKGRCVGKLRFKGRGWFKTFVYNQSGFKVTGEGRRCKRLYLSKIGPIPIRVHRDIKGKVKQVTIKREQSGRWFAILSTQIAEQEKRELKSAVGIDLGIQHYLADSTGKFVEHPHTILRSERRLAKAQRRLSRKRKGSKNRQRQRKNLARIHEKIRDQRFDFLHKLSSYYITNYDLIAIEDLEVKQMIEDSYDAKNMADASWSAFIKMLGYKAADAGARVIKVDPKDTTQKCSRCGNVVGKPLWVRVHKCPICGLDIDRDLNASRNILKLGLAQVGQELPKFTPV